MRLNKNIKVASLGAKSLPQVNPMLLINKTIEQKNRVRTLSMSDSDQIFQHLELLPL